MGERREVKIPTRDSFFVLDMLGGLCYSGRFGFFSSPVYQITDIAVLAVAASG